MDRVSPTARFRSHDGRPRGFAYGVLMVLAVIALLMGLAMAGMGAWLMFLGGSWYYLLAGVAIIIVAAVMLARRMTPGVSLFALVVAATLVWSLLEIHAQGWTPAWGLDLAGRLGLQLALLGLMVVALAFLRRGPSAPRTPASTGRAQMVSLGVATVMTVGVAVPAGLQVGRISAQDAPLPPTWINGELMSADLEGMNWSFNAVNHDPQDHDLDARPGIIDMNIDESPQGIASGTYLAHLHERDISGLTPIDAAMCRIRFHQLHNERMTTPSGPGPGGMALVLATVWTICDDRHGLT